MGNLSHYAGSNGGGGGSSPAIDGHEVGGGAAAEGYASEDFVPGSSSGCRERKKGRVSFHHIIRILFEVAVFSNVVFYSNLLGLKSRKLGLIFRGTIVHIFWLIMAYFHDETAMDLVLSDLVDISCIIYV